MMLIKCSDKACNMVNQIEKTAFKNHVLNGGKPIISCKGCKTKLEVMPLKATCDNPSCGKTFKYFDFLLKEEDPLVKCPHCQGINRVKIKVVPKQFKKLVMHKS